MWDDYETRQADLSFVDGKLYKLKYTIHEAYTSDTDDEPKLGRNITKITSILDEKYRRVNSGKYVDYAAGTEYSPVHNDKASGDLVFVGPGVVVCVEKLGWHQQYLSPGMQHYRNVEITYVAAALVANLESKWRENMRKQAAEQAQLEREAEQQRKAEEQHRLKEEKARRDAMHEKY